MKRNKDKLRIGYAKGIFENGFSEYDYDEFVAFSRYANSLGWTKEKIEKEIIRLCSENPEFNIVLGYNVIHKASMRSKYPFIEEVEGIWITKNEIEFFRMLPEKYGKVLFVTLVMAKRDNPRFTDRLYYNYELSTAINASNNRMNAKEYDEFNYWCGSNDYLLATRKAISSWEIRYFGKDEGIIYVNDFKKIVSFYPYFCSKCNNLFTKTSSRNTVCNNCK